MKTEIEKPRLPREVNALIGTMHKFIVSTNVIEIQDVDQRTSALELTKTVKNYAKDLEAARTILVKPLNDKVKDINAYFKTKSVPLLEIEQSLKTAILTFEKALKAKEFEAAEALRKVQEAANALSVADNTMAIEVPVQVVAPKMTGVSTVTSWQGNVNDKKSFIKWCLDNDQLHLLDVNQSALNTLVRSTNGTLPIPGVGFTSNDVLRVKA